MQTITRTPMVAKDLPAGSYIGFAGETYFVCDVEEHPHKMVIRAQSVTNPKYGIKVSMSLDAPVQVIRLSDFEEDIT